MRYKYKTGVGGVSEAKRRGYAQRDQDMAVAECKMAQFLVQSGRCTMCPKAMVLRYARWINSHGRIATLSEWAKRTDDEFDPKTLSTLQHPRSPLAIHQEFADGNRGHELACSGCAQRFSYAMYGENGAGAAYDRNYQRIAAEMGFLNDPANSDKVHAAVIHYLSQSRLARLEEEKGRVMPEDVEAAPKKARPSRSGRKRGNYRTKPQPERPAGPPAAPSAGTITMPTDAEVEQHERGCEAKAYNPDMEAEMRKLFPDGKLPWDNHSLTFVS